MRNKLLRIAVAVNLVMAMMVALGPLSEPPAFAQTNLRQPTITTTGLLNLTWTAGTVNNGGHAVAIASGSTNGSASRTDCAAPTYTTCGWLYANSSGTVASTTSLAVAAGSGNSILALYESNGTVITKLSFPMQNSQVGLAGLGYQGVANGTSLDLSGSLNVGVAGTTVGTVVFENATTGTITLAPTTGALGTVTATLPAANITIPGVALYDCGTANACSPALKSSTARVFSGISAVADGASPALIPISGLSPAYTSASSYHCTATLNGAAAIGATGALEINYVSSSAFTIVAGNGVNITASWMCVGF